MKVQKVNDFATEQPVQQIAENPAGQNSRRNAGKPGLDEILALPGEKTEHADGNEDKQHAAPRQHAPCGPPVQDAAQIEESGDDAQVRAIRESAECQPFRELVRGSHEGSEQKDCFHGFKTERWTRT